MNKNIISCRGRGLKEVLRQGVAFLSNEFTSDRNKAIPQEILHRYFPQIAAERIAETKTTTTDILAWYIENELYQIGVCENINYSVSGSTLCRGREIVTAEYVGDDGITYTTSSHYELSGGVNIIAKAIYRVHFKELMETVQEISNLKVKDMIIGILENKPISFVWRFGQEANEGSDEVEFNNQEFRRSRHITYNTHTLIRHINKTIQTINGNIPYSRSNNLQRTKLSILIHVLHYDKGLINESNIKML